MEMADAMVSTGLAKLGYEYINVGAGPSLPPAALGWGLTSLTLSSLAAADAGYLTHERDSSGKLVVDSQRFPSGMRKLADHVHSRGLKLGVCAPPTCPAALLRRPGRFRGERCRYRPDEPQLRPRPRELRPLHHRRPDHRPRLGRRLPQGPTPTPCLH